MKTADNYMWIRQIAMLALVAFLIGNADQALALRSPKPIATDNRIRTVMYSPNEVFKFVGHYGYQSVIEFAGDEEVQTISMGDTLAWLIQPAGSRLFLKPIEQNATTNMTVITNKHTYLFELHGEEAKSINDPSMIFVLRMVYNDGGGEITGLGVVDAYMDSVPLEDVRKHPERYNFNYTITGSEEISPIRIFDDGKFTYFEFRDKNAEVPAFFLVDAQGYESLINFRTRDSFIVVERVAGRYTLRHGNYVVCVYNETKPQPGRAR